MARDLRISAALPPIRVRIATLGSDNDQPLREEQRPRPKPAIAPKGSAFEEQRDTGLDEVHGRPPGKRQAHGR
jgi:hypothetical protein